MCSFNKFCITVYNTKLIKEVRIMLINLDVSSGVPIYLQLRNEIVMGIGGGDLAIGEGLPTVRQLAQDIGVNTMTVNKAYNLLKSEGYIEINGRHGAKINPTLNSSREFKEKVERELQLIVAESGLKGIVYKEFMEICEKAFQNMNGIKIIASEG